MSRTIMDTADDLTPHPQLLATWMSSILFPPGLVEDDLANTRREASVKKVRSASLVGWLGVDETDLSDASGRGRWRPGRM